MTKIHGNRLNWIDSLRGLAALGVVAVHLFSKLRYTFKDESVFKLGGITGFFINDFFNLGKIGVVVFFFVSGFVIPYSLNNRTLGEFTATRFFRLYPAYWLSIVLSIILIGTPSLLVVLANITMFQKFFGVADINVGYWTLQIELIFYIICALLYYKGVLYHPKTVITGFYSFLFLALLLAVARYFTSLKLPVAVPLALDVMFLGIMFRKLSNKDEVFDNCKIATYLCVFVATLLPICFLAYNKDYGFDERWYKYFSSYIFAIVFFIMFYKFKWNNKFLSFLGAISYSLYLLHPVVGFGGMKFIRKMIPSISSFNYILLFTTITLISAILSYYFIEKPAVTWGKLLTKHNKKSLEPSELIRTVATEN